MRCPARVPRKHAPGGWRSPSGPTTGLCRSVPAGRGQVTAGNRREAGPRPDRATSPEERSPCHKPRGGAPAGAAIRSNAARVPTTIPAPAGAPLPSCLEGRSAHTSDPIGAARQQRLGCLTFESDFARRRKSSPPPPGKGDVGRRGIRSGFTCCTAPKRDNKTSWLPNVFLGRAGIPDAGQGPGKVISGRHNQKRPGKDRP
jgi:hypothetical protein